MDWAARNNIPKKPPRTGSIPIQDLQAIITENNITIRPGDILFIRVGFTAAYNVLTPRQQEEFSDRQPLGLLGLEANRDSLRWLWESRFVAVASDSPSFERGPVKGEYNDADVTIHQWALAGWGLPLGEMFDLEELAETARRLGRRTFFLASMPLKVCDWIHYYLSVISTYRRPTATSDSWGCCESAKCGGYFLIYANLD